MKHLFKQPLFYSTVLSLSLLGFIIASYVFGWTTPTQNPPAGNVVLSQGALPSGSRGYVQFASSSTSFGGDANLFWDNTNKRLGIGTSTPSYTLDVVGTLKSSATTTLAILGGNVGIGTTTPSAKLEVAGNIKLSGSTPTYKITNVAAPTATSDVATKGYVDAASVGYSYCRILSSSTNTSCNLDETAYISTSGTGCIGSDLIINLGSFGILKTYCSSSYGTNGCGATADGYYCSGAPVYSYENVAVLSIGYASSTAYWVPLEKVECGYCNNTGYNGDARDSTVVICCK